MPGKIEIFLENRKLYRVKSEIVSGEIENFCDRISQPRTRLTPLIQVIDTVPDQLQCRFDGYFRLNAGIRPVTSNMLESSGTTCRFAFLTFSPNLSRVLRV